MVGRMQVRVDLLLLQIAALEPDQILDVLADRVDVSVAADLQQGPAGGGDIVLDGLEIRGDLRRAFALRIGIGGGRVAVCRAVGGRGQWQRFGAGDFALLDGMNGAGVGAVGRALGAARLGLIAGVLLEELAVLRTGNAQRNRAQGLNVVMQRWCREL